MSDTTINAIWFTLMFLLLIVSCAVAFFSFIWLIFAAASGMGLMPWLILFPMSLVGVWITAGRWSYDGGRSHPAWCCAHL